MTKRGIGYLITLALLAVFAFGTGIRELHLITCCMAILLAYSLLSALLAAFSFSVKSEISSTDVYRRDSVIFTVHVKGFAILPVAGDVYVAVPGKLRRRLKDAENHVFYRLPGKCSKDFTFDLKCNYKGLWYVGIKQLKVHDVFGLFSFPLFRSLSETKKRYEVKVYPAVYLPDEAYISPPSKIGGAQTALKESESGDSVSGSRKYAYGDAFKRINWKLTARTRQLHVRTFELEQNPHVLIILDLSSDVSSRENAQIAADIAVSLNRYYINEGNNVKNLFVRILEQNSSSEFETEVKTDIDFNDFNNLLLTTSYYTQRQPLIIPALDTAVFSIANTIHVISSNPSVELLSSLSNLEKEDCIVNCIVPMANESVSGIVKERSLQSGFTPTVILEPSDIIRTLGGRL